MTHTKEPWAIDPVRVPGRTVVSAGDYVAVALIADGKEEANARRIVACVNALAGIPTEELERGVVGEMQNLLRSMLQGYMGYADEQNFGYWRGPDAEHDDENVIRARSLLSRLEPKP